MGEGVGGEASLDDGVAIVGSGLSWEPACADDPALGGVRPRPSQFPIFMTSFLAPVSKDLLAESSSQATRRHAATLNRALPGPPLISG